MALILTVVRCGGGKRARGERWRMGGIEDGGGEGKGKSDGHAQSKGGDGCYG